MNELIETHKDEIRSKYLECGSIKQTAKELGYARNTVRHYLREDGLTHATTPEILESNNENLVIEFSFPLLEKFFEHGKSCRENLDFEKEVMAMAEAHARDLRINNYVDLVKLENAMLEWIAYRRYYYKTISASDDSYDGPYKKAYDKVVQASKGWRHMADKSLLNYERIIRNLELRCGRIKPSLGQGNTFINHQEIKNDSTSTVEVDVS